MELFPKSALLLSAAAVLTVALNAQSTSSGVDLNAIDTAVSPCTNFYQYACGTWIKNNPLPSDQSRWNRFNALALQNQEIEKKILEQAAASGSSRSPIQQKIGDYYNSCMDEAAIDKKGVAP